MPKGERLDVLVVSRGLLNTREAARTAIIDGAILVDGNKLTKPGMSVSIEAKIELVPGFVQSKFKSRGGVKLQKALDCFGISVKDRICLDIGASTGGFTDCLLKYGAQRVYAIDVGYGQLDWTLRNDKKVVVKERQNARYLSPSLLYDQGEKWSDFATIDVSFISLTKILPACLSVLMPEKHEMICLIKPQFEAGKDKVAKGGIVKSKETHKSVIQSVVNSALCLGLSCHAFTYSPIKGPKGNIEFLIHLASTESQMPLDIDEVVERSHAEMNAIEQIWC